MKITPTTSPGRVALELGRRDEKLMAAAVKDDEAGIWPSPLKNILVPIDFSEPSKRALEYALPLAEKLGATLTLIHVIEPRVYPEDLMVGTEMEEVDARLKRSGQAMLDSLRREKIEVSINSISIVTVGKPWQQIIATAKAVAADMIIIATHGYTGLKHVFLGSTAERVVRHTPCPVLTVRKPEREFV
jgi:universal stress protein A